MPRRLIALILIAWTVVPTSGALAAGVGGIGIRVVDPPLDQRKERFGRSYIIGLAKPGSIVVRHLEITNTTRSTERVAVYAAAAELHRGLFGFAPGRSDNELSGWTSVSLGTVNVPAGAKAIEAVRIRVPADATPGKRLAVVWAEVSAPVSGVRLVNRVGVRVYLTIGSHPASPGAAGPADTTTRQLRRHPVSSVLALAVLAVALRGLLLYRRRRIVDERLQPMNVSERHES